MTRYLDTDKNKNESAVPAAATPAHLQRSLPPLSGCGRRAAVRGILSKPR